MSCITRHTMARMGGEREQADIDAVTAHLDPPFAVVDLDAFDHNATDLVRRAAGTPIALWLAGHGHDDLLVAYPTADRTALRALAGNRRAAAAIAIMVDDVAQLDLVDAACGADRPPIRVCLDVDASWRPLGGSEIICTVPTTYRREGCTFL